MVFLCTSHTYLYVEGKNFEENEPFIKKLNTLGLSFMFWAIIYCYEINRTLFVIVLEMAYLWRSLTRCGCLWFLYRATVGGKMEWNTHTVFLTWLWKHYYLSKIMYRQKRCCISGLRFVCFHHEPRFKGLNLLLWLYQNA